MLSVAYALGTVDLEDGARSVLNDTISQVFGDPGPDYVSAGLVQRRPRQALLEASDGVDMLLVGRSGRGGFPGLLVGSASQACIAHARCPVLVVN